MNKTLRTILLGLIVWGIPFLASFFVWDVKLNAPAIDLAWFYALMGFAGAVGFALAAYYQFKNIVKNSVKEAWKTAIIWYFECVLLDLTVLVGLFGMSLSSYSHLSLAYLTPATLAVAIGYIKK